VHVRLSPASESAHAARVAVSDFLVRLGRADLVDDVTLIAAELVANAVMHARTEISLAVEGVRAGVRVTVVDGSDILPRWTPSSTTATAGRGLLLVEQLSARWGFDALPGGGKGVWAEIVAPSGEQARGSEDDLLALWARSRGPLTTSPAPRWR
jgi:anti-sigma regulatory factor (Ser/Thr protein kinase)